jgi:hypothetical protein
VHYQRKTRGYLYDSHSFMSSLYFTVLNKRYIFTVQIITLYASPPNFKIYKFNCGYRVVDGFFSILYEFRAAQSTTWVEIGVSMQHSYRCLQFQLLFWMLCFYLMKAKQFKITKINQLKIKLTLCASLYQNSHQQTAPIWQNIQVELQSLMIRV